MANLTHWHYLFKVIWNHLWFFSSSFHSFPIENSNYEFSLTFFGIPFISSLIFFVSISKNFNTMRLFLIILINNGSIFLNKLKIWVPIHLSFPLTCLSFFLSLEFSSKITIQIQKYLKKFFGWECRDNFGSKGFNFYFCQQMV